MVGRDGPVIGGATRDWTVSRRGPTPQPSVISSTSTGGGSSGRRGGRCGSRCRTECLQRVLDDLGCSRGADDRQRGQLRGEARHPPGDEHVTEVGDVVAVQMRQQQRGQAVGTHPDGGGALQHAATTVHEENLAARAPPHAARAIVAAVEVLESGAKNEPRRATRFSPICSTRRSGCSASPRAFSRSPASGRRAAAQHSRQSRSRPVSRTWPSSCSPLADSAAVSIYDARHGPRHGRSRRARSGARRAVGNALKHSPPGGRSCSRRAPATTGARIAVATRASGIPPDRPRAGLRPLLAGRRARRPAVRSRARHLPRVRRGDGRRDRASSRSREWARPSRSRSRAPDAAWRSGLMLPRILLPTTRRRSCAPSATPSSARAMRSTPSSDGADALVTRARRDHDLAILDVMMPGPSGLDRLPRDPRRERAADHPADRARRRGRHRDRPRGRRGRLRHEAVLRRRAHEPRRRAAAPAADRRRRSRTGASRGGRPRDRSARPHRRVGRPEIRLTSAEFELLLLLAEAPGQVFTRPAIMEHLWRTPFFGDERAADTHVANIRRKIERDPARPTRILTVRGVGYKLGAAPRT